MTGLLVRVGLRTYNEVMTSSGSLSGPGSPDPQNKPGFIGRMVLSHPTRTQDTMLSTATYLHTFDDSASIRMVDVENGPARQRVFFWEAVLTFIQP
jgi:hypothetical protein